VGSKWGKRPASKSIRKGQTATHAAAADNIALLLQGRLVARSRGRTRKRQCCSERARQLHDLTPPETTMGRIRKEE
jgi:hypothetical protein